MHVGVAHPLISLMGYEHQKIQWEVVGAGNGKYTHSVPRDTQCGWSLGQGSDAILMHVGVAQPLSKLMG